MASVSERLGVQELPTPEGVHGSPSLYRGRQWGRISWGHDEFSSWFGITLKKGVWNRITDEALIQDGFYGVLHAHS